MANLEITINTIFDGLQPSALFGQEDEYRSAIGIDPDMPLTDSASDVKTGGVIRPVQYATFSGGLIDSHPIAIITTPKTSLIYVVLGNGKLLSYTSSFGSETLIGQVLGNRACGAEYYNNYIYIRTPTDVSRYGPLDGTASLTNSIWTGSTLGTLTALVDTLYPTTLLGIPYLNHFGVTHLDGSLYFLDYNAGVGMVHMINTKKVTNEGDTNDTTKPSAYNILDLPFNYMPISISSIGNDLVVSASLTNNGSIIQGKAALFFFNPADVTPSFYKKVTLPDAICSALRYANGILYGWSGQLNGDGYRLFQYVGGDTVQTLKYLDDGYPPLQGAVESLSNKQVWAADTTDPMIASGLWGYGSKSDLFSRGLHHLATSSLT